MRQDLNELVAMRLIATTATPLRSIATILNYDSVALYAWYKRMFSPAFRKMRKSNNYSVSKRGDKNPMSGKFGDAHHNYKGVISDKKGYHIILKPDWYTGRKRSKHVFYHHYVYCLANGLTEIPIGYDVHHKDENKLNNAIENLQLLSRSEHARLHQQLRLQNVSKE